MAASKKGQKNRRTENTATPVYMGIIKIIVDRHNCQEEIFLPACLPACAILLTLCELSISMLDVVTISSFRQITTQNAEIKVESQKF